MYKIGDKVKVISSEGMFVRDKNWNFIPVIYSGFITTVNLVEDDVVWIEDINGGSVWIELYNIQPWKQ